MPKADRDARRADLYTDSVDRDILDSHQLPIQEWEYDSPNELEPKMRPVSRKLESDYFYFSKVPGEKEFRIRSDGTDLITEKWNSSTEEWDTYGGGGETIPIGSVMPWTTSVAPVGYEICNGGLLNRITFSDLFNVIGTDYGVGDGSTTFNKPDYRGVFLRGAGEHGTLVKANGNAVDGGTLGDENVDQMFGHYHSAQIYGNNGGTLGPAADGSGGDQGQLIILDPKDDGTHGTPNTGDETAPANVAVTWIIRATNISVTLENVTSATIADLIVTNSIKVTDTSKFPTTHDLTSGNITKTLPLIDGSLQTVSFYWTNGGTYKLTLAVTDSETVGGLSAGTWLGEGKGHMVVESDGSNWQVREYEDIIEINSSGVNTARTIVKHVDGSIDGSGGWSSSVPLDTPRVGWFISDNITILWGYTVTGTPKITLSSQAISGPLVNITSVNTTGGTINHYRGVTAPSSPMTGDWHIISRWRT